MTPMTLELAQTLHGYTQGHRLLAHGGDILESELHELDRLSDLSGYLPTDASFTAYHTGFPCGRYHAFACTWPDHAAPRRGTVLTHTLLIPRERWVEHADPFAWSQHHRKPASALEREAYSSALVVQAEQPPLDPQSIAPEQLRGLLQLWLGQPERPVLWVDEPSLALVRALWPWLWREARQSLAFCTFALQVRSTRAGRPFDLLVVPPPALGSFHEQGASRAWWLEGRVRRGEVEPWIDALIEAGPAAVTELITELARRELEPPPSGMFRAAQRYVELRSGASERLAAARAQLDMLARLWPELPAEHTAVRDAIASLLARQADAPLDPRPLWDLGYLLAHPYVQDQLDAATPLGQAILDGLYEQLLTRLRTSGGLAGAGLVELYASGHPRTKATIRAAIPNVVEGDEPLAWGEALLDHEANHTDDELERVLWQTLPISTLVAWLNVRLAESTPDERGRLRTRASALASERASPELARAAWAEQIGAGIFAAASVVASHPATAERFEKLLLRESEFDQLIWCLDCEFELLRTRAIRIGAALMRKDKPALPELAARCQSHRLGAAIFNEACPWALERELEEVLRSHERLAQQLVQFLFEGSTSASSLVGPAGRAVPGTLLWTPASRMGLATGKPAKSILDVVVPRLLTEILAGGISADEAGAWLTEAHVAGWLRQAGSWELERPLASRSAGSLPRLVAATRHALRSSPSRDACLPLGRVLEKCTRDELSESIDAIVELLTELPPSGAGGLYLRAELLSAVDRNRVAQAWRVAELAFPPVYLGIIGDVQIERVSWWRSYSWDRGKHWRHWLLDTWVTCGWPPDSLVRCLSGNVQLAERVFKRASKLSGQSKALLRALEPALGREPGLRRVWAEYAE